MVKARWFAFIFLLLGVEISIWLFSPANELLRPFCPYGFWHKPLLFGARYCGYAPVSILGSAVKFGIFVLASLLCVLVLRPRVRLVTVRVLLLLWLIVPVVLAIRSELSWSLLAAFAVALSI